MKYIEKKKRQWQLYLITRNKEQEQSENLTKNNSLINVNEDDKTQIIQKIKNIKSNEFSKIETKKDGNCMYYAILKTLKINEIRHLELRQITADYIESIDYEEEEKIFQEENCQNKQQYIEKIKKMENILIVLYLKQYQKKQI